MAVAEGSGKDGEGMKKSIWTVKGYKCEFSVICKYNKILWNISLKKN